MAATKASTTALSAVTTTQTSSAVDVSSSYSLSAYISIAVVGAPSAGASFKVQVSPDGGTTYYDLATYTSLLTAATYYWVVAIPADSTHAKVAFTAQTGGTSSTCTAQIGKVTGL